MRHASISALFTAVVVEVTYPPEPDGSQSVSLLLVVR